MINSNAFPNAPVPADSPVFPGGHGGSGGEPGKNAFSPTSADFVVPTVGATVDVELDDVSWITPHQMVYVQGAGAGGTAATFQVTNISGNTVTLFNPPISPVIFRDLADTKKPGLLNQLSGSASDFVGGDNQVHPYTDIPLADANNPGLLVKMDGSAVDMLAGDNSIQLYYDLIPLASPSGAGLTRSKGGVATDYVDGNNAKRSLTSTLDSRYVNKTGDTMTGALTVNGVITTGGTMTITGNGQINSNVNVNSGLVAAGGDSYLYSTMTSNGRQESKDGCQSYGGGPTCCVWDITTRATIWWQNGNDPYFGNSDANGNYIGDWNMHFNSDFTSTPRLAFRYPNVSYGSNNYFGFGWGVWGGYIDITIDNAGATYPITSASDIRMKGDISPSELDCLAIVKRLPLVEYRLRDFPRDSHGASNPWKLKKAKARPDAPLKRIGMVAQQINEIFPEGVMEGDDYDDHLGRMWSIDQNNFLALLTGALQQLKKKVELLKKATRKK
jgi:hypothetical protein